MTETRVLYDDSEPLADALRQVAGVQHYGDLLFRRRRLADTLRSVAAEAGWEDWVRLRDRAALSDELQRIQRLEGARHYLLLPSRLAWDANALEIGHFLRALRLAEENIIARRDDLFVVSCTQARLPLVAALHGQRRMGELVGAGEFSEIGIRLNVADLARTDEFMAYFTNAFETRHFNRIGQGETSIEKWSADKEKIHREYTFLKLLPESLRHYFAHAFDYREDNGGASYRVERFYVPDAAMQWVHQSVDERACAVLLGRLQSFFAERPTKEVSAQEARAEADRLYEDKVGDRIEMLKRMSDYAALERAILLATRGQSLDHLLRRYLAHYAGDVRGRRFGKLALTHGDLCLSNILFARESRIVKFIDARGAGSESELFSDEHYDLAKLSHSFLGRYDWINNGLADIVMRDDATLDLVFPGGAQRAERGLFCRWLADLGYSLRRVRLYEASLFLSMLPLHVDHPRKVVQFAAVAARLLDALEDGNDDELQDC